MRVAIFGDVHANLPALEALASDLKHTSPDMLVFLGDAVDGFGHPRECVDLLRAMRPDVAVLGNAEWRVREWPASASTLRPGAEPSFAWLMDEIGETGRAYLGGLPLCAQVPADAAGTNDGGLLAFHGLPDDPWTGIRPHPNEWPAAWLERTGGLFWQDEARLAEGIAAVADDASLPRWLVCGHTHLRMVRRLATTSGRDLTIVNPGALTFGNVFLGGRLDAHYALLDRDGAQTWRVTWRDVAYDRIAAAESLQRLPIISPFMQWIADALRAQAT